MSSSRADPKEAPRRPRADQQRNRRALLDAARTLFAERGLHVALDEVARQAGVGNATLYRHFPDRQALLIEVVVGSLHRHEEALVAALALDSGWAGFSQFLTWLFTEQVLEVEHLGALRAIPAGENADVDRLRKRTLSGFEQLIARAKAEGRFRADRWAEDVFLMLFLNEQLSKLSETPRRAASQRFLDLTLAAVGTHCPVPDDPREPPHVLKLRHTLGHDLAGLPHRD